MQGHFIAFAIRISLNQDLVVRIAREQRNPDYQILIEAYTDSKGNEVTLQQLTQERARVLSDRFQSAGVDPTRIQANGMGASNPVAPNTTVAGQKKNRRVEITFTSPSRNAASN